MHFGWVPIQFCDITIMGSHNGCLVVKEVIYAALAGNTLIATTKFAAEMFTGSSAM